MTIPQGPLCTWLAADRQMHVGRVVERADGRVGIVEWDDGWPEELHRAFVFVPETAVQYVRREFLEILLEQPRKRGCACSPFRLLTSRHDPACVLDGVKE